MSPERQIMDTVTYAMAMRGNPMSWECVEALMQDPKALREAAHHERVDVPYRLDLEDWANCLERGESTEIFDHLQNLISVCQTDPEWTARAKRLWPFMGPMFGEPAISLGKGSSDPTCPCCGQPRRLEPST